MTLLRLETLSLSNFFPLLCLRLWGKSRGALLFALLLGDDGVGYTFPSWLDNSDILTTMVKKIPPIVIYTRTRNSSIKGKIGYYYYGWCQDWDLSGYSKNGDWDYYSWNAITGTSKILDCISPLERNWLKQSLEGLVIEFLDRSLW